MEGPPLGPDGEDITWPDQVAPRGRKASSTRKIKPQTSNLKFHLDLIQGYLKGRQSIFKNVTGQLVVFSTIVSLGGVAQPRLFSS